MNCLEITSQNNTLVLYWKIDFEFTEKNIESTKLFR